MNRTPTYRNVHNRFKINGSYYSFSNLALVANDYIKEGKPHEKVIGDFLMDWIDSKNDIVLKTSGSTGTPKLMLYSKQALVNSALATGNHFNLKVGDRALHCLSADFVAGKMMLVRAMILGLELDVVLPNGNVLEGNDRLYDFAAMVPLQASNTMGQMDQIKTLLIGGAAPSSALLEQLQTKATDSFVTYGMTETLTHIASRSIKSKHAAYHLLPGVKITQDNRQCLTIEAPHITDKTIITNDLVDLKSDTSFTLLGRVDNVINSAGVKIIPELVEQKISTLIDCTFFIGSIKDERLGEKVVLVLEKKKNDQEEILALIKNELTPFETPKRVLFLDTFIYTENGKLKRKETLAKLEALPY